MSEIVLPLTLAAALAVVVKPVVEASAAAGSNRTLDNSDGTHINAANPKAIPPARSRRSKKDPGAGVVVMADADYRPKIMLERAW